MSARSRLEARAREEAARQDLLAALDAYLDLRVGQAVERATFGLEARTLDPGALLRLDEAGRLIGRSGDFVRREVREGRLPEVRMRDALRVRVSDLHDWIDRETAHDREQVT